MKSALTSIKLLGIAAAVWLALNAGVGIFAVESALHPLRRQVTPQDTKFAKEIAEKNAAKLVEVSIRASDGAQLRAWEMHPAVWNGDAVILLHGQSDNRAGMLGNADLLLHQGYAVLLPDARAHGASDGELATYGIKEAEDIRRWSDSLRQSWSPRCIDGLGESMGAAQLLQSLEAKPGFCAVIAECSFTNFKEAAFDRLGEQFHAGPWVGRTILRPAVTIGILYARWKYGVDLAQSSPERALRDSDVPAMLIHGLRDTNLPPRHAEMIVALNAGRNPKLVVWEPGQAGHCGAAQAEPFAYQRRVIGWFHDHDQAERNGRGIATSRVSPSTGAADIVPF
jgi:pimeloyl-ACP methyl ester carboxylesterase